MLFMWPNTEMCHTYNLEVYDYNYSINTTPSVVILKCAIIIIIIYIIIYF